MTQITHSIYLITAILVRFTTFSTKFVYILLILDAVACYLERYTVLLHCALICMSPRHCRDIAAIRTVAFDLLHAPSAFRDALAIYILNYRFNFSKQHHMMTATRRLPIDRQNQGLKCAESPVQERSSHFGLLLHLRTHSLPLPHIPRRARWECIRTKWPWGAL